MGLTLAIFDDDGEDVEGFQVGHYSDFARFRDTVSRHIPEALQRYPTLMGHSDCEGEWSLNELPKLKRELAEIGERFKALPFEEPLDAFEHAEKCRTDADSLYDSFHNVDEENLFEALQHLCDSAIKLKKPISFQ